MNYFLYFRLRTQPFPWIHRASSSPTKSKTPHFFHCGVEAPIIFLLDYYNFLLTNIPVLSVLSPPSPLHKHILHSTPRVVIQNKSNLFSNFISKSIGILYTALNNSVYPCFPAPCPDTIALPPGSQLISSQSSLAFCAGPLTFKCLQ